MKISLASLILSLLLSSYSPIKAGQGYTSPYFKFSQEFNLNRIVIAPDLRLNETESKLSFTLPGGLVLAKSEPIHHKIKRVFRIDGWHFFHLLEGAIIGNILSNESLQFWLYDRGFMPWTREGPWLSPGRIMIISGSIAFLWEVLEYWDESRFNWQEYNDFYAGYALQNNGLDFVFHCFGTWLTTRNNLLDVFIYTPRQGSYFVSISIPIGALPEAGFLSRPLTGGRL